MKASVKELVERFELEELRSAIDQISTPDMFFGNDVTVTLRGEAVTANAADFASAVLDKRGWTK